MKQVLAESTDIAKCLGPLSALATGSSGADLFLPSCPFVVGAHVNTCMRAAAAGLESATLIDTSPVSATVVKMVAMAERFEFDEFEHPTPDGH